MLPIGCSANRDEPGASRVASEHATDPGRSAQVRRALERRPGRQLQSCRLQQVNSSSYPAGQLQSDVCRRRHGRRAVSTRTTLQRSACTGQQFSIDVMGYYCPRYSHYSIVFSVVANFVNLSVCLFVCLRLHSAAIQTLLIRAQLLFYCVVFVL